MTSTGPASRAARCATRCAIVCAARPPGRTTVARSAIAAQPRRSPKNEVMQELDRLGISALSQPEHRSLADFDIGISSRDLDQLVERGVVMLLREYERPLLAQGEWLRAIVESREVGGRDVAFAEPEQGILAR